MGSVLFQMPNFSKRETYQKKKKKKTEKYESIYEINL